MSIRIPLILPIAKGGGGTSGSSNVTDEFVWIQKEVTSVITPEQNLGGKMFVKSTDGHLYYISQDVSEVKLSGGAQTSITSILNTSLGKIGTAADQEYIDFGTSDEINTFVNNTERLSVTNSGVDITGNLTVNGSYGLVSGDIPNNAAATSGNATTATRLANVRTINGVNFNGGANITVTAAGSTLSDTVPVAKGGTGATSLNNLITLSTHTQGNYVASLTAGTLISLQNNSGEGSTPTINVDLSGASEAEIENGDYILFLDGGATGATKKEALADVATLFAGNGLATSNSVLNVEAAQTSITSILNTSLGKIGTASDQEYIDFATSDKIKFKIDDTEIVTVESNGLVLGGIPDDASYVTPNNSAQIIYFKTGTTVSAGNAVRINGNMLVEPYSSGTADTCVGIALTSGTGSMMEASVAVQVSGIMKVTGGIYKASDSSAGGVAGELCDCSSGTITSREENTADDASDFIIVHSNDLSGAAYVMWLKGSVQ